MPQPRKKKKDSQPVEKAPVSEGGAAPKGRYTGYFIISVVVVIILTIMGSFYYREYVAPFRRVVITVDDTQIRMDYFLKRIRLGGGDSMGMLQALTNEQIIKREAARFGVDVRPADIDRELRRIASGGSENMTETEFREWYRQRLNEARLSDAEYKEIVTTGILAGRLQQILAERVPTVAEQIHLHAIVLRTYEEAQKAQKRLKAGTNFATLARELSIDEETKEKGGDMGWLPRGVLSYGLEHTAFSLSPGEISDPVPYATDPASGQAVYFLFMVSEKADARELGKDAYETLKSRALQDWLMQQAQFHAIKYNFNSEIYAWINWQLAKK